MEQDMATSSGDAGTGVPGRNGIPFSRRDLLALAALGLASSASRVALAAAPQGQLTWGVHVSLAPTWFDPAETPGIITPFMVFYATATGAGWIVPKKYVEKVGEDGFKKAPIGAGPYKFVSFDPGIELTLEAFDGYWRKPPGVKRLVFRCIPDEATRLAAL